MRIFNVATELAPYSNATGLGADVAKLLAALVLRGHEVRAIAPLAADADPSGHPLARRLNPIVVPCGGAEVRFTRFEGRSASGVAVDLLQPMQPLSGEPLFEAFNLAALELVRTVGAQDAACVSWNRACAPIAALDAAPTGTGAAHYVAIRDSADGFDGWKGPAAARRIILNGRSDTDSDFVPGAATLRAMLDTGRAIALPRAVDEHPPLDAIERASAKASIQAAYGLPVRADVPLALFTGRLEEGALLDALGGFLRGDVQAIALCRAEATAAELEALAERYPDRLTVVPAAVDDAALLAGADLCAAIADAALAARARSFGAIPIAATPRSDGAVDLEPSLASGTAFVAGDESPAAIVEAIGRGVSAFRLGKPFAALSERLATTATTWSRSAALFEQILSEP
jgi:hypothetical protein